MLAVDSDAVDSLLATTTEWNFSFIETNVQNY